MENVNFLVNRNDIHDTTVKSATTKPLAAGDVLLAIDHFAFTANNITYAAFGDAMKYWDFFPAQEGWGCVPVWGFADVIESKCDGVAVGERFYGYYPMASHLRVTPAKLSKSGFIDSSPHRRHLSTVYNNYQNVANDPGYNPKIEDLQMLFQPLFMTSFLIDDFLEENDFFGAQQVILSSASSKTAYGLAFMLSRRPDIKVIGLTSPSNVAFTESLGFYDQVITYDDISALDTDIPATYVDMAGSGDVRASVHVAFADNLTYSCSVGASHWDKLTSNTGLPGAKPTMFFAPDRVQQRTKDWGPAGVQQRSAKAWQGFIARAGSLIGVVHETGTDAMGSVYSDTLNGKADPKNGYILSF
ncbi:MAG: DUF2855 family protein [Kordiimonadaceae bacterium]|nr:DUF2855 family protein [Kordiimonadaceae bacterium]